MRAYIDYDIKNPPFMKTEIGSVVRPTAISAIIAVILPVLVIILCMAAAAAAEALPDAWRVAENISAGDSYTYLVCNDVHAVPEIYPNACYTLRMDFVYDIPHHVHGPVWIVDVDFNGKRTVMFLAADDPAATLHATSAWDRRMAESVQRTIMHLAPYGEQSLDVGSHWGSMPPHLHYHANDDVPLAITSVADGMSILSYDVMDAHSRTVISPHLAFPVYSKWHDPDMLGFQRIIHEYTLLAVGAGGR